jgi:tetratricopeptide (TPR) repeat protein
MKPANIMLVPSEATAPIGFRAVITDFGLARLDPVVSPSNLSAFSNTARPIGTLAYMAPEQLENAHISSATDIYAFGLVLFEMVTGTRAFPSDNLLSGIAQRLTGSPPLPQSLVPDLPIHWCRTIEGCLRLKPTDRFQFASDVMEVLDGKHIGLLRIVRPSLGQRLSLATGPIRRRVLSLAAICLVMVALFLGGLRIYRTVTDLKVAPGALVYLAPVSNQTGEKSLDNVTELIGAGLSQSVQVNLLDQGRVGDILQRMTKAPDTLIDPPIAREIAMRAGAVRVIFATVTGSAGSYSLNIDIQQPDASDLLRFRDHWPKSFLWHTSSGNQSTGTIPAELLSTIRTTSDWIRHEVGESANDIARLDAPPEDVTTGNWQALGEYKLSRELSEKDRPQEEVIALERAVEIDPGFALAWGRLGDLLMTLHRETEGYDAYDRATSQELLNRLSSREKYRILGMQAEDQWRWQDAERYFENWQTLYPNDYLAFVYPSWSLRKLGKADLDVENLRRAVELAPGQTYIKDSLAEALMIDGHHQEGREIVAELLRNGNSVDRARLTEARIDFLDFRFDDAARDLQALTHSSDRRALSDSFLWLASFFAEQGRFHEAWETLTEGMQADRKLGHPEAQSKKLIYRGWISAKLGRFAECAEDVHEGLKLDSSPSQILRAEDVLGGAITIAPTASTRELRTEMVEIGTRLPKDRPGPSGLILELRTRGEILLAQGHAAAAVAEFRKLDKIDSQVGSRDYLGRSLLALAAKVSDSDVGTQLRREAMTAYSQMALRPNCLWGWAISYPPGFWADELTSYLKLANELGDDSSSASAALTNLHRLRGLIFPNAGQDSSHLNKRHNNANRSQRNSEEYHGSN